MYEIFSTNSINRKSALWGVITVICSAFFGYSIISNNAWLLYYPAGLIIYACLSVHMKIFLLALGVLYPISFGNFGPIQNFYWVEWMAPFLAMIFMFTLAFNRKRLMIIRSIWLNSALLALVVTVVVNYARNPVLGQKLMGAAENAGGIRSYYDIAAGICLFFVVLWYFEYYFDKNKKSITAFLGFTAVFSICLGFLQLAAFYYKFELPFLYSVFRFKHILFDVSSYGGTAFRIGGLSECAIIGLSAILSRAYKRKIQIKEFAALVLCAILLILSGGRTHAAGALVAVLVYSVLSGARRTTVFISCGILVFCLFGFMASSGFLGGQLERYITISKGYDAVDQYRDVSYKLMLDSIERNPVFGKGIGYAGSGKNDKMKFALAQLKVGGHGAYISILSLFGILGLYFLIATLTNGIIKAFFVARGPTQYYTELSMFILMILIIAAISYFTGGDGYSDMWLYSCAGITAGLSGKGVPAGEES